MNKIIVTAIGIMIGIGFIPGIQATLGCITVANGYTVAVVGMAGVVLVIYLWGLVRGGLE